MKFPFWSNKGREYSNSIADHLNIDRNLFGSALLEIGITWNDLKALSDSNIPINEGEAILAPKFLEGLQIIENKYGPQQKIAKAKSAISDQYNSQPSEGKLRYLLKHYRDNGFQKFRGDPIVSQEVFQYESNSLEELENKALVFIVGGDRADIIDTRTGKIVYPEPELNSHNINKNDHGFEEGADPQSKTLQAIEKISSHISAFLELIDSQKEAGNIYLDDGEIIILVVPVKLLLQESNELVENGQYLEAFDKIIETFLLADKALNSTSIPLDKVKWHSNVLDEVIDIHNSLSEALGK